MDGGAARSQRPDPRSCVRQGDRAHSRRQGRGRLRRARLLVSRFESAHRDPHDSRRPAEGESHRIVAGRSAISEAACHRLSEAGRQEAEPEAVHPLRRRRRDRDRRPRRALPRAVELSTRLHLQDPTRVGVSLSLQSTRPSGAPPSRHRRQDGSRAGDHRRDEQHLHRLCRQVLPRRAGHRRGDLDVRTGRLESPLPHRRGDRQSQERDHRRGLVRARRRSSRCEEAASLVPGRRHRRRSGSVPRPLLPGRLRRQEPGQADGRRRHAFGPLFAGRSIPDRHLLPRRSRPGDRASPHGRRSSLVCAPSRAAATGRLSTRPAGRRRNDSSPRGATTSPTSTASSIAPRRSMRANAIR